MTSHRLLVSIADIGFVRCAEAVIGPSRTAAFDFAAHSANSPFHSSPPALVGRLLQASEYSNLIPPGKICCITTLWVLAAAQRMQR